MLFTWTVSSLLIVFALLVKIEHFSFLVVSIDFSFHETVTPSRTIKYSCNAVYLCHDRILWEGCLNFLVITPTPKFCKLFTQIYNRISDAKV